jgi:ribosomal protein L14
MGTGSARVNGLDAVDCEEVAGRRPGKVVGAVAGADGQRIDAGPGDEVVSLVRVGQQLPVVDLAGRADAVFLTRLAGFRRTEATQFAFHRNADDMGHFDHLGSDLDVVGIVARRLAVGAQRAVHHHAGKASAHRLLADGRRGAVVMLDVSKT